VLKRRDVYRFEVRAKVARTAVDASLSQWTPMEAGSQRRSSTKVRVRPAVIRKAPSMRETR
jgi:hypothetical protein